MMLTRPLCLVRTLLISALASLFAFVAPDAQATPSFQGLGGIRAFGISADSTTVAGQSGLPDKFLRWTQEEGWSVPLDGPPNQSRGLAASADGTVIVGGNRFGAFRWTEAEGYRFDLWPGSGGGPGSGPDFYASAISADGLTIVGLGSQGAMRWTESEGALTLPVTGSVAGISADGSIVVANDGLGAIHWTQSEGVTSLPCDQWCSVGGISGDGSVIVGWQDANHAVRWTNQGAPEILGEGYLTDASYDGGVIVGRDDLDQALIWTQGTGMRTIQDALSDAGVTSHIGWSLWEATGVSADGRTIVGNGLNPNGDSEAWIATIPEPTTALLLGLGLMGLGMRRRIR